jgi:hypothetical protein
MQDTGEKNDAMELERPPHPLVQPTLSQPSEHLSAYRK